MPAGLGESWVPWGWVCRAALMPKFTATGTMMLLEAVRSQTTFSEAIHPQLAVLVFQVRAIFPRIFEIYVSIFLLHKFKLLPNCNHFH